VAADGTIFITDGVDTTYALNRDGTVKWSYNIGANSGASHSYNPITGNLFILAGTIQDNNQRVTPFTEIALDKNGKLLWDTTQPGKALPATSIPELSQNGYLYNVMGDDSSGTLVMSYGIIDQQTGAIVSTAAFDSLSGAFSALDNQGNIYVTSDYPQPQYATGAGQIVLLPGAVVGTVKLAPQAPSVCGLTTGPNKSVH